MKNLSKFCVCCLPLVVLLLGFMIQLSKFLFFVKNSMLVILLIQPMDYNVLEFHLILCKHQSKEELIVLFRVQTKTSWYQLEGVSYIAHSRNHKMVKIKSKKIIWLGGLTNLIQGGHLVVQLWIYSSLFWKWAKLILSFSKSKGKRILNILKND